MIKNNVLPSLHERFPPKKAPLDFEVWYLMRVMPVKPAPETNSSFTKLLGPGDPHIRFISASMMKTIPLVQFIVLIDK